MIIKFLLSKCIRCVHFVIFSDNIFFLVMLKKYSYHHHIKNKRNSYEKFFMGK